MEPLIFEMGLYKATIPADLLYSEIHFWFRIGDNGRTQCGLTAYAARLLTDLFRLDWSVKEGDAIEAEQVLGEVESTKAVSELYAPMSGKLLAINQTAVDDPSMLGVAPYATWLFEFEGRPEKAMTAQEYVDFLALGWDETVKLLKGQV
jgi:glycine cleavage system H protein